MDMDPIVKTILPVLLWTLEKVLGPVLTPSEWRAIALSFVPPPDSLVDTIKREYAEFDTPALLAPTKRRQICNRIKHYIRCQLRGNPFLLPVREYLLRWRRELEAKGYAADPSRIRKLRVIETETNDHFACLLAGEQIPDALQSIVKSSPDATNLLWEFARYGEGGEKPELRRSSNPWKILGLDPQQLDSILPTDGLILCLDRFMALFGLAGQPPDEPRLRQLAKWVIRTHLPAEEEPITTPKARSKAMKAGLIHHGHEVRDDETGAVMEVGVEDEGATRLIREVEDKDELERIISRAELSPGERLVLQGMWQKLQGEQLVEWVTAQGVGIARDSVPVLASRVKSKLKAAAKT